MLKIKLSNRYNYNMLRSYTRSIIYLQLKIKKYFESMLQKS